MSEKMRIKIFADGADRAGMLRMYENPLIKGFTTNPTLMCKAGISDYANFAKEMLKLIPDRPISFEVFADELNEMEVQAYEIASWATNIMVKIPITNTRGVSTAPLIRKLSQDSVVVNVTAILTLDQVQTVADSLSAATPAVVSVFAGRIADTGVDPVPMMQQALDILKRLPRAELLWASPRELLNVVQANHIGCHIITATNDILQKLSLLGKDLHEFSLETVRMFYQDALTAGFKLKLRESYV